MTEVVVDMLVREGRLDLDAPVSHYIAGFPNGPSGGAATVRHLLTHRAGVPHRVTSALEETQHLTPSDIVGRVRAAGLLTEPGTVEAYSSAGFTCLARVIEIVEDKPFDSVLVQRIFAPASMVGASGETGQQLMRDRATPYRLTVNQTAVIVASAGYKDLSFLGGAGSVYATGKDLLQLATAVRHDKFGSAVRRKLITGADTTVTGWYGRTNGYEASMDFVPATNTTIVILSNLQSGSTWQIRTAIRRRMIGVSPDPIVTPPAVAPSFEPATDVIGKYGDAADPVVIAQLDGVMSRDDSEFFPIAGGSYYLPSSAATMHFRRNSNGVVDALVTRFPRGTDRILSRVLQR